MATGRKRKASEQQVEHTTSKRTRSSTPHKSQIKNNSQPEARPEIVGGLNGDYRITGNEVSKTHITFTIPTDGDKIIPCELHGDPPSAKRKSSTADNSRILIFTHGAGGGLENPATRLFAEGYASTGAVVLCFQGTMNLQNRAKNFETIYEYCKKNYPGSEIAVGGRSMGARAAVLLAQKHEDVKKLVLSSYPLTSPKGDVRDKILLDLPKEKVVYFLTGDHDSMCDVADLDKVRNKMSARSTLLLVRNGDHSMSLVGSVKNKAQAVETIRKRSGAMLATGIEIREMTVLEWNNVDQKVTITQDSRRVYEPTEENSRKRERIETREDHSSTKATKATNTNTGKSKKAKSNPKSEGNREQVKSQNQPKTKGSGAKVGTKSKEDRSRLRRNERKRT